jgi:hypothetical protein
MKRLLLVVSLLLLSTAPARADHEFGLGLELGAPTGLAGKYYLKRGFALEAGIGYLESWNAYQGLHIHFDGIWHPAVLTRQESFNLAFTIGIGGRVFQHHYWVNNNFVDEDTHLGIRVPIGLDMDFFQVHLDLFLEIAVVLDFAFIGTDTPEHDHANHVVDLNPVLGVRYFF